MKHCRACDVDVATPAVLCPLCGTPPGRAGGRGLRGGISAGGQPEGIQFCQAPAAAAPVVGAAVCIVVKSACDAVVLVVDHRGDGFGIRLGRGAPRHQPRRQRGGQGAHAGGGGSALAVLVDFETGYRGWGVSFVVPAFICAGIVAVVVLVMCNRTNWAGYVLYQAVLAVFGLAMPVLYFTGLAHSLVGAVVPSILAVATLAGMAVFRRPDDQKRNSAGGCIFNNGKLAAAAPRRESLCAAGNRQRLP